MLNFTVGPVQSSDEIRAIGAEQVPYFRTAEFSAIMLENEALMKKLAKAEDAARVVFITGSGTASMEAAVINTLTPKDKAIVIDGGSFGHRFVQLCQIHDIPHTVVSLDLGRSLTAQMLAPYENQGYTAFLVNVGETSTGILYDMELISAFCKRNHLFLITDTISSFLADPFNMAELGSDVMITGSQKALACPPGISVMVLSARAQERILANNPKCMYLNLQDALKNGERGQTPFTPAVGILRQINARLRQIDAAGGVDAETARIAAQAADFRQKIRQLPFEPAAEVPSNAVTSLRPTTASAYDIFLTMKDEYGIWICPNGGSMKDTVFRVGHIGDLTHQDNTTLVNAFLDMQKRGLI